MDSKSKGERIIFVGGAPRSGTSMLQSMLDSHPAIYGGPEFDFVPAIADLRNKLQESVERGRIDSFCTKEDVDAGIASFIEHLLLPSAERHNKRLLSEKTPMNVLVFPSLLEIFPKARFIHMVRDPRAVTISMLKVADRYRSKGMEPPNFISNPGEIFKSIMNCVATGEAASRQYPDRVYTMLYEKLVSSPEQETRSLCEFLNIEWSESMLTPELKDHVAEKALKSDDGLWAGNRKRFSNPEKDRINSWKQGLTKQQIGELTNVVRELEVFKTLGYNF